MTPQQIEVMKLALDALVMYGDRHRATYLLGGAWDEEITLGNKAITALEEALAEHAMSEVQRLGQEIEQERTWVGLTKQQQLDIFAQSVAKKRSEHEHYMAIEQALKERNQ